MLSSQDTIVASATPHGRSALSVLRLSGPKALSIARSFMRYREGHSHRMLRARLLDAQGQSLDDGMVCEMHAPASYTGEDVVEYFAHGNPVIVDAWIKRAQEHGARLAEPGEFTQRAFLNGRMALDQAEAVMDVIEAQGEEALRLAQKQLRGRLSKDIESVLGPLESMLADYRAALDFPDFPTGEGAHPQHQKIWAEAEAKVEQLLARTNTQALQTPKVVLCGPPNAGKSSLLNYWAGEERVIVDAEAGTTRDAVSTTVALQGGRRIEVWDTAGIREEAGRIEKVGIEQAFSRMDDASCNLWLLNAEQPEFPQRDDVVLVISKADLLDAKALEALEDELRSRNLEYWGAVSTQDECGLKELEHRLEGHLAELFDSAQVAVVSARHHQALLDAQAAMRAFVEDRKMGMTLDVLSLQLELCCKALGAIIGRDVESDVLEAIFKQFCIGK